MSLNKEKGIASILPVLLVVGILLLAFSFKNHPIQNVSKIKTAVLSESSDGGDSSGTSGNQNVGSQTLQVQNQNQESSTPEPVQRLGNIETPEPSQTPEVKQSPEPTETPSTEAEVETEVKDGTLSAKIKIQKGGNALQFEQDKSSVQVQGNFPVSVNPNTKELTINTPAGSRVLAVLPDTAAQNVLDSGILSQITANAQNGKNNIKITTDSSGNVIYEINGVKFEKLLGLFNVSIDKTVQVSAQNGQVAATNQSLLSQLLDILSF